ncbi:MAG: 4-hydroxy-2-oxoheptanedioate aldolase [Betaproteobacteria bacterium]|jgi:4-hydroxy-2-oxoheptanedioate aldolase|nr:4-hydroxy-2-oxoheptanedioate aldolase [Betaproteobacteria bacterium]
MDLPVNQFKQAIKSGKPQIGIWSSLCSYIAAEVLADAGFDWVLLDTEHSPNELPMVQNQLDALSYGTSTTEGIVRPAWNDIVLIKRYLDVGARTLLIPYVQNAEEARRAVTGLRYPPGGMRGVSGCTRANRYGRVKDYFKHVHDEVCLLLQVETRTALSNLEAIAEIDGVDGIFIGPNDLAADMGHLGNWQHPEVWKVMEDAAKRIRKVGKAPGILVGEADGKRCIEMGYLFVAVGSDLVMLARGADALAAKFK